MEPLVDAMRAAQEFHPEIIRAAPLIQNDKQACRLPASRMAPTAVPMNGDKVTSTLFHKCSGCGLLRFSAPCQHPVSMSQNYSIESYGYAIQNNSCNELYARFKSQQPRRLAAFDSASGYYQCNMWQLIC